MTLARKHIRRTTAAERNERRQRAEDKRALYQNLKLVLAGGEPTVEAAQAVDPKFLAFVHTLPCCAEGLPGHNCRGEIQADHVGARGYGNKCIDSETIALAEGCHEDRHASEGPFSLEHWTFDERRAWLDAQIAATQAAYARHTAATATPQPGAIAVGDPVSLGGSTGSIAAVLAPDRVRVAWLSGTSTEERIAAPHRRA